MCAPRPGRWTEDMKDEYTLKPTIDQVAQLRSIELNELIKESVRCGFNFVERLRREWESGANRFARDGEALFVASIERQLVGICGLNIDPFCKGNRVGRIRRLYVCRTYRRRGIGTALVERVCAEARKKFRVLRVGAGNSGAAAFYESVGFAVVEKQVGIQKRPASDVRADDTSD